MDAIKSGEYSEGEKIPSEYELANKFHVNKKTANLAVSTLVAEGVLERSRGAAGTKVKKSHYPNGVITFLGCLRDSFNFWGFMVKGAQDEASRRNYALQFIEYPQNQLTNLWEKLIDFKVSGMLVCSYGLIKEQLPFPIVHIDLLPTEGVIYNSVNSDNFEAGYLVGRHLLEHGHTEIVFVQKNYEPHMFIRANGFVAALKESGIHDAKSRVILSASEPAFVLEIIKQKFPSSTAIAYDCDHGALEMCRFLIQNNIKIPEQISITGFGALTQMNPVLRVTSVEQNPIAMGRHACSRLIDIIEGISQTPINDILPVELFNGDTVAPPCENHPLKCR